MVVRDEVDSYESFKRLITHIPHNLTEAKSDRIQEESIAYQVDIDIKEDWFVELQTKTEVKYHRVDTYWIKVFDLKAPSGKPWYPELSSYVPSLLTLAHGNFDVEKGTFYE